MTDPKEYALKKYFYGWTLDNLTGDYVEDTLVGPWLENEQNDRLLPKKEEYVNYRKESVDILN